MKRRIKETHGSVGVNISGGVVNAQNLAGEDINISTQISDSDLARVFRPIVETIKNARSDRETEAIQKLEALMNETEKGKSANHPLMMKLLDDIVALVPSTLKAFASVFAEPVLKGVAGPVTQFLLHKMTGD